MQVDGYNATKVCRTWRGRARLLLRDMRRNSYELATAGPAPIASEALKLIAAF
ncbi:hypothetical protein [Bradyrhizobium nanningense]|uniref:hypothetical protein n=1 Tax=Bradyrhizobium nanningense TaxID=1325118 RepID=UPI003D3231EA